MSMQKKAGRTVIDQALCDHVRLLLAGGAKVKQVAEMLSVGHATISRIKAAGFSAEEYDRIRAGKRVAEEKKEEPQLDGQMKMELVSDPVKMELVYDPEIAEEYRKEQEAKNKDMRFQAAMMEKVADKLEKINDTLHQMLRAMSGI